MQFGRKQIFTDVTQITKDNVIKVLQDALIVHEQNRTAIKFLLDYERGIQPIDDRIKEIRPEINIKVKDNMAA
ncbi:MAG TPA: phage portal protein, partial [Lachnospiraceae bacterium]|nr:phage portal protein [Lachnospiraceae bacterium]